MTSASIALRWRLPRENLSVRGSNAHHMVEACFKVVARCLRQAIRIDGNEVPSSKGVL